MTRKTCMETVNTSTKAICLRNLKCIFDELVYVGIFNKHTFFSAQKIFRRVIKKSSDSTRAAKLQKC